MHVEPPEPDTTIRPPAVAIGVGTFGGASGLPARVAVEMGAFERHGLEVNLQVTRSSDDLAAGLQGERYQVVHAAPDNYVAWSDRSGARVDAWIGGSNGPISLVAQGREGAETLRGGRFGVDAPDSGFAPILRRIMARAGVEPGEVTFVTLGATRLRYEALLRHDIEATMLTLPWSLLATREGAHVVTDHRSVAPYLQTSCAGSLRSWLAAHPDLADRYLIALREALDWLADPSERPRATRLLADELGTEEDIAEAVLGAMLDPATGWPRTGEPDPLGIAAVCELRSEVFGPPLHPAASYMDPRPHRRVTDARQRS